MDRKLRLFIYFPCLIISLLFLPTLVRAETASKSNVSCTNISDPEFHSLRPYPGSTDCTSETSDLATFCGNDLTIKETITKAYPGDGGNCTTRGDKVYCNYNVSVPAHSISISLTEAELPIMGNTEDVANSKSSTETLNDADKMNGYVSWYLNGVVNRAEYDSSKNSDYNVVNFSGPIQKLYPHSVLEAQRIKSIDNVDKKINHNQIVACGKSSLGILGDVLNIGTLSPTECYPGNGSPADKLGATVLRLESWNGNLSLFNTVANAVSDPARKVIDAIAQTLPTVIREAIEESIAGFWNKRTPPLPWSDENGKPFETELLYRKAYNEWSGKTCVIVPAFNWLVCLDNVLVPNKYADLFSHIPLSTTEDVPGEVKIDSATSVTGAVSGGTSVKNIKLSGNLSSKLSLPHLAETDELGRVLQDTYTPLDQKDNQTGDPTNVSSNVSCSTVEVRSNPGDNLYASNLNGSLSYDASFSCVYTAPTQQSCYDVCIAQGGILADECRYECYMNPNTFVIPTPPTQTCSKDVYIKLTTKTKVPLLDDIWSRLVAGPMAVFKRIFPKTNTEGSVGQIMDIPGSTNITYSGTSVTSSNTDLKFPHVGGISQYFLNGIQTALRPKGFGESLTFDSNQITNQNGATGNLCDSACNTDPTNVNLSGVKEKFIDLAGRWVGNIPGNPRIDMYDTVVNAAKNAGVDPIFVVAIWLHESGGSNYLGICNNQGSSDPNSEFCQKVQDFGINDPSIETYYNSKGQVTSDHFMDQLNAFLDLPGYYKDVCGGNASAKCPLEYFYAMYYVGQCNPINKTDAYGASIKSIYSALTSQNFACYPIKLN